MTKYITQWLPHGQERDMVICTVISSDFFFLERKYPGRTPNLKLDTLYVSHYGFVDKGTKNNGGLKIKLLCSSVSVRNEDSFSRRKGY